MDRSVVTWVMFFVMTLGIISFTPNLFIDGSDYTPEQIKLPDTFKAWTMLPGFSEIKHTLNKGPIGAETTFDFSALGGDNRSLNIKVRFNMWGDNLIRVLGVPTGGFGFSYNVPYVPVLTKVDLIGAFNPVENNSFITFKNVRGEIVGVFEDNNATRNDIGEAWDDGEIDLTLSVPIAWESDDDLGAREVVVALLTFNLPTIFRDINPMLGFVMSASLMIPLLFMFFTVVMWGLHGE